jgi:hypothetical protein
MMMMMDMTPSLNDFKRLVRMPGRPSPHNHFAS